MKIIQLDDILLAGQEHFLKIRRKQEVDEKMKSKFKKLLATALVLCLVLALLPAAAFAGDNDLGIDVAFYDLDGNSDEYGSDGSVVITKGTEDKEYVITATPSEGFGLTTIKVKVNDTTVIETPHNSSTIFTQTFEAEGGNTVSVYASFLPMYKVQINGDILNGTVTSNVNEAFAGGVVTLTVTPITGYSVSSVSVTTTGGAQVEVEGSGNSRTFSMPESAVDVGATFVQTPAPTRTIYPSRPTSRR
ncbi:MAG: InlB B-repeat-containing protein [Oscillospiraceae bacterium]